MADSNNTASRETKPELDPDLTLSALTPGALTPGAHTPDGPTPVLPVPALPLPISALILFDGLCGFCNGAIRLLIRHDRRAQILFAPLQSELAANLLARHGLEAARMESVALLIDADTPAQRLFLGPEAVGQALAFAERPWPLLGRLILATPRWLREPVYRAIATIRYRLFGKFATCPIPTAQERSRFLGL